MVQEQKFEKEYAKELINIAFADLEAAKVLAGANLARVENVFLLAQQALEKGLKAVICWNDIPVPFVNDIGTLVATIRSKTEVPFGYNLNTLSEYATIRGYLEGHEKFKPQEINEILSQVETACKWCKDQVN